MNNSKEEIEKRHLRNVIMGIFCSLCEAIQEQIIRANKIQPFSITSYKEKREGGRERDREIHPEAERERERERQTDRQRSNTHDLLYSRPYLSNEHHILSWLQIEIINEENFFDVAMFPCSA